MEEDAIVPTSLHNYTIPRQCNNTGEQMSKMKPSKQILIKV